MPVPLALASVGHCNVNCSDLTRSRAFYEGVLGLAATVHTNPAPQDGSGFGLAGDVQWDAWMLADHRGAFTAPVLDLLQWVRPAPVGTPRSSTAAAGHVALRYAVPTLDGVGERVADLGGRVVGAPAGAAEGLDVADPDGTVLRLERAPVPAAELRGVVVAATDLERSAAYYGGVLGLVPAAGGGLCRPGDDEVFAVELVEATGGRGVGAANHLGIFRLAFMVEDLDACDAALRAAGVEPFSEPVALDMGPEVPLEGGLRALFFPDPDGTCLELIEIPT